MAEGIVELQELVVNVDDVIYMPSLDSPPERPHPFVYFITITNDSPLPVRLYGRKWIVKELRGETTVVEGEGIIGQKPIIAPGEDFSYNSYHVVAGAAEVTGSFFGKQGGQQVFTQIPAFHLDVPKWA